MFAKIFVIICLVAFVYSKEIWVKNAGHTPLVISMTGEDKFTLDGSRMVSKSVSDDWSGKIWSEPEDCLDKKCEYPRTTVEIAFSGANGDVKYDISLVDGFNKRSKITSRDNQKDCRDVSCERDILQDCPSDNQVNNSEGHIVGCKSSPSLFQQRCPYAIIKEDDRSKVHTCKSNSFLVIFN